MDQEEMNNDTICALATAPGGALGIIRVSGPDAFAAVSSICSVRCDHVAANTVHYTHIVSPILPSFGEENPSERIPSSGEKNPSERIPSSGEKNPSEKIPSSGEKNPSEKIPSSGEKNPSERIPSSGEKNSSERIPSSGEEGLGVVANQNIIDEVMVSVFCAPHSYTGEDSVEISCHGSSYILNKVLELLVQNGCRMANPGEFTQRAYLNGKMDLSQAEAVADLIASSNKATHQIAMSQLRGGISTELSRMREQLLKLTSLLELELDFSDHEDLEFADRSELLQLAQTIDDHIAHLAQTFEIGNALKNGIPVAIVGAPNVGKSTLLNALLGEERAIVSDIQGTTRDAIEDTMQLGGVTFRFIDTAGIRHTDDTIENLGIERSMAAAQRAQIILMMTEPGIPYPDIPVRDDQTIIRIENKTEGFQAKFGVGLDQLRQQLIDAAPKTADNDVIITNARHYDALTRAQQHLQRVIDGLQKQLSGDLLSEDLRFTLDTLAEITGGQITPNEVLGNIFKHFCVGK